PPPPRAPRACPRARGARARAPAPAPSPPPRGAPTPPQRSFGALDIDVERNGYGTQIDSFSAPLEAEGPLTGLLGVFIRAPRIRRVGPDVTVLARERGEPLLVRHGPISAPPFPPHLPDDARLLRAS